MSEFMDHVYYALLKLLKKINMKSLFRFDYKHTHTHTHTHNPFVYIVWKKTLAFFVIQVLFRVNYLVNH